MKVYATIIVKLNNDYIVIAFDGNGERIPELDYHSTVLVDARGQAVLMRHGERAIVEPMIDLETIHQLLSSQHESGYIDRLNDIDDDEW